MTECSYSDICGFYNRDKCPGYACFEEESNAKIKPGGCHDCPIIKELKTTVCPFIPGVSKAEDMPGDRVLVAEGLLFKDDISTPYRTLYRPGTIIKNSDVGAGENMNIKVLCTANVGKYLSCNETIECDLGKVMFSSNFADLIVTCPKCGGRFTISTCDKCGGSGIQYPNSELKEKCIECNGYGFQANEIIQDAPTDTNEVA